MFWGRISIMVATIVTTLHVVTLAAVEARDIPSPKRRRRLRLLRIDTAEPAIAAAATTTEFGDTHGDEAGKNDDPSSDLRKLMESKIAASMSMEERFLREEDLFFSIDLSMSMLQGVPPSSSTSTSSCTVPTPFDTNDSLIKIHLIMNIVTGDYFEQLIDGMKEQSSKMGNRVDLVISDSGGNETTQADYVLQAAALDNDEEEEAAAMISAIITVDGSSEVLCDSIVAAIDSGIPVVSFDFKGDDPCVEGHILAAQSDFDIAELVLVEAAEEFQEEASVPVGYISDLNYQPLQNRNDVWEVYSKELGWDENFFLNDAASYATSEELQTAIEEQFKQLGNVDDVQFVYAPWGYLAVNTVAVIDRIGSNAKVYGADINNEDIKVMTEPNSPFMATAGGIPKMIGAAILRTSLLQIASEIEETFLKIPSSLFTQEFLLEKDIADVSDLVTSMPELRLHHISGACWIDPID